MGVGGMATDVTEAGEAGKNYLKQIMERRNLHGKGTSMDCVILVFTF